MAFGRGRSSDDEQPASWREQGERHADKARLGLGTPQAPLVHALLAIYSELRHQNEPVRLRPPEPPTTIR